MPGFRLVSLMSILGVYAFAFCTICSKLKELEDLASNLLVETESPRTPPDLSPALLYFDATNTSVIDGHLSAIEREAKKIKLKTVVERVMSIRSSLERQESNTTAAFRTEMRVLREIIKTSLSERQFLPVEISKASYFNHPALFGEKVHQAFESARGDIKEAGSCYALGRNTACVFHLVRAFEHGLRALCKRMGIRPTKLPIEYQDWSNVIAQLERKIQTFKTTTAKSAKKIHRLEFYQGVIGEARAVEDSVRNPLMHGRLNFNEHDALSILNRVCDFMKHLAPRVSERTLRKDTVFGP